MNGLSDLELVAQAMAPTNDPSTVPKTTKDHQDPNVKSATSDTSAASDVKPPKSDSPRIASTSPPTVGTSDESARQTLQALGINADSLSPGDLESLRPILDAMSLEVNEDSDELQISELLAQMDAADGVASDLEGKLDLLLEQLAKTEGEMQATLPK